MTEGDPILALIFIGLVVWAAAIIIRRQTTG